jgi:hypothetical protein
MATGLRGVTTVDSTQAQWKGCPYLVDGGGYPAAVNLELGRNRPANDLLLVVPLSSSRNATCPGRNRNINHNGDPLSNVTSRSEVCNAKVVSRSQKSVRRSPEANWNVTIMEAYDSYATGEKLRSPCQGGN